MAEHLTFGAVSGAIFAGVMIGAYWGYTLAEDHKAHYPWALIFAGWIFVATMLVVSRLDPNTPAERNTEWHLARMVLWAVMCSALPIGRYARYKVDVHLLKRKIRKVREQ